MNHRPRLLVAAPLTALIAASTAGQVPAAAAPAAAAATTGCRHITGPFHARGNLILNAHGKRYVPIGGDLNGMAKRGTVPPLASEKAQIHAWATWWCANTVRIQVRTTDILAMRAWRDALSAEVRYARSLGLVVVINALGYHQGMPTATTLAFWRIMTRWYGRWANVMFDLYNEPGGVGGWRHWRNGFTSQGVHYIGMQQLASYLRRLGARNVFWVEGLGRDGFLSGIRPWLLRHVGAVAYTEHRPPGRHTWASWDRSFGYLARYFPVFVSEWTNYARSNAPWACWPDARWAVPRFLRYLAARHLGLIAHKLTPGRLIESARLTDPTHLRRNFRCTTGLDQGAGDQIRNWDVRRNGAAA